MTTFEPAPINGNLPCRVRPQTFVCLFVTVVINVNKLFTLPDGILDAAASGMNNQTPLLQGGGGNVYHGR